MSSVLVQKHSDGGRVILGISVTIVFEKGNTLLTRGQKPCEHS